MIGQKIKELREEKNLTQEALSNALGISRPTLANYETNFRQPSIEMILKLADFFDVTLDYLFDREK